jgi:hypothetical protein
LKTSADEPDAASSEVWLEDTLSSMSQLSSLAESLRNISRPDEINQVCFVVKLLTSRIFLMKLSIFRFGNVSLSFLAPFDPNCVGAA